MADKKPFDRNYIDKKAEPQTSGFLDQLNLPPGVVFFIGRYKWIILITVVLFLVTVISIPLYNAWWDHRNSSAATALAAAMHLDGEAKTVQLEHISEQYASTPSGLWAMGRLAEIKVEQGNLVDAVSQLAFAKEKVSADNPLKPLLIIRMAKLNEELKQFEEAVALYRELRVFPGFAAEAYYSMGRVYAAMGKNNEAVSQYQKYLAELDKTHRGQSDSHRAIVEKAIKALQ